MTRMLLMGPPGSGKGTQATRIADKLGIVPISTGDIFRHNVKSMTPLGVEAKKYIDNGDFVPDEVTNRMVADRIAQADAEHGFLLDGYPRTKGQVEALDAMLAEAGQSLSAVVELEVPDEELVELALADLTDAVGLSVRPVDSHVQRWGGALPQYAVGHLDRVSAVRRELGVLRGLAVCGSAYDGVGIPACIASAEVAAVKVLADLATMDP